MERAGGFEPTAARFGRPATDLQRTRETGGSPRSRTLSLRNHNPVLHQQSLRPTDTIRQWRTVTTTNQLLIGAKLVLGHRVTEFRFSCPPDFRLSCLSRRLSLTTVAGCLGGGTGSAGTALAVQPHPGSVRGAYMFVDNRRKAAVIHGVWARSGWTCVRTLFASHDVILLLGFTTSFEWLLRSIAA